LLDPSTKKTPASRPVFQILNELEMEDKRKFNARMIKWEAKEAKYNREESSLILPLNTFGCILP
jgi:hypothetical protein